MNEVHHKQTSFRPSFDGSTIIVDTSIMTPEGRKLLGSIEAAAMCHTCERQGALDGKHKPLKWAIHYAGNARQPKRLFICDECCKVAVRGVC